MIVIILAKDETQRILMNVASLAGFPYGTDTCPSEIPEITRLVVMEDRFVSSLPRIRRSRPDVQVIIISERPLELEIEDQHTKVIQGNQLKGTIEDFLKDGLIRAEVSNRRPLPPVCQDYYPED